MKFTPRGITSCPKCNQTSFVRIDKFDAIACKTCKNWVEDTCSDRDCEFCSKRPETAINVNWNDSNNTNYD